MLQGMDKDKGSQVEGASGLQLELLKDISGCFRQDKLAHASWCCTHAFHLAHWLLPVWELALQACVPWVVAVIRLLDSLIEHVTAEP